MQLVKIINTDMVGFLPIKALYCESFLCRFRGLMFRGNIQPNEGLLIVESQESRTNTSIHMFFMKFDIAAVWINNNYQVVDVVIAKKWHPAYFPARAARYVLETHSSRIVDFSIGDQLSFETH